MKKIIGTLYFIFIILLYYLTKNSNMILLTISFSMYLLFKSIFSTTSIKSILEENKKDSFVCNKIFKLSIIAILVVGGLITGTAYLLGNIIKIDNLDIVNIFMSISLITCIIIKLTGEYLEVSGYKKIGSNLFNIYNLIIIIIDIILSILLFKVFKLENYINISILYSSSIFVFILLETFCYIFILKKRKGKKEKINYIQMIKKIIVNNSKITIFNIVKSSYLYISIILLYYVLLNKYNYNFNEVGIVITNTYFYGITIIYYIYLVIRKYIEKDLEMIKEKIINKTLQVENLVNAFINKIINLSLSISILLFIISGPISTIFFHMNYNVLFDLVLLLFFYILFDTIIDMNITCNKNKHLLIILFTGLMVKLIFEIPLINTVYRMGYALTFGSILADVLGFIISIFIGYLFIKNKLKLNFLSNFNNLLNIIYENILLCLILILFTLIVKVDTTSIIGSLLVIIFYIVITILFYVIKRIVKKKSSN